MHDLDALPELDDPNEGNSSMHNLGALPELDDLSEGNSSVEQNRDSDSESTKSSEKDESLPKVKIITKLSHLGGCVFMCLLPC